jgi:predicted GH43/DUF377 family glycosyl hydrolase
MDVKDHGAQPRPAPARGSLVQVCLVAALALAGHLAVRGATSPILQPDRFRHYIVRFNEQDQETVTNAISNAAAGPWLEANIPRFECPDPELEEVYYFRWWTFRKHLKQTPDGFVVTEFLPAVPWAGRRNTISCAAGHHFYEGRWLHDTTYLRDYARFWFRHGGEPRRYSFWAADALYATYLAQGEAAWVTALLPDLVANFEAWEKSNRDPCGLFWQVDDRDGMEVSIGGSGYRATINSYMFGDAQAIAWIAALAGQRDLAQAYCEKAERIRQLVEEKLWDPKARFFKVLPRGEGKALADVRELHGYVPWYFNLPYPGCETAWRELLDPDGFWGRFGPTTAERRHPRFRFAFNHECLWNGPSWPYATTQTLVALANHLNSSEPSPVGKDGYLRVLRAYAASQHRTLPDGRRVPWIDENLDADTGEWVARKILHDARRADRERGKDYNHSGFCDLIITGLVGLRPQRDDWVLVNPLVPEGAWSYFCLDDVAYHGQRLTILFDRDGTRYGRGKGLRVLANGKEIAAAATLGELTAALPPAPAPVPTPAAAPPAETSAGWRKSDANPVLGGDLGTCFDVALLREADRYRMWFSWRPRKSLAVVESTNGVQWSAPRIVLGPRADTKWEDDINRPVVVKRADGYHLWYTGQAKGHSWIGYATSADGVDWQRQGEQPVLSPDAPWEKVALMCPHVLWDEEARLFRMWYSGGEQYEPDAIGYATSADGRHWSKASANPIFKAAPANAWEQHKVTACQVVRRGDWYYMFYIGFRDTDHAQIGVARSRDGTTGWERHPANPIIRPGLDRWDHDACYKPFAIFDGSRWLLWYNGRRGGSEQIGLAIHEGKDLGF